MSLILKTLKTKDEIIENNKNLFEYMKETYSSWYHSILTHMINNPSIYIIVFSTIINLIFLDYLVLFFSTISGSIFYGCIELHNYLKFKKEKTLMDEIDIDLIKMYNPKNPKNTITNILGEFVEDIFNRDILFFEGFKSDEYINSSKEQELLEGLIDRCTIMMSPLLRKKLGLYFGEENIDIIIGRQCFSIITMFVASHNKNIYTK
jgi:hypothetical protein